VKYGTFYASLQLNIFQYSAEFSSIVKRISESLKQYVREDGSVPHLGDETLGAILPVGNKGTGLMFYISWLICFIFNNAETAGNFFSPDLSHYLYLMQHRLIKFVSKKTETFQQTSFGFRDAAIIFWEIIQMLYFIKIAGYLVVTGRGAPGHNILSHWTFLQKPPFIVDSGTYSLFAKSGITKYTPFGNKP